MEYQQISSLLAQQPDRTLEAVVTHFEDIPNWKDEKGIQHEVVVLAFLHEGVTYIGTCVLGAPAITQEATLEDTYKFKEELNRCWNHSLSTPVRFSAPPADAMFTWPVVRPIVKKQEAGKDTDADVSA